MKIGRWPEPPPGDDADLALPAPAARAITRRLVAEQAIDARMRGDQAVEHLVDVVGGIVVDDETLLRSGLASLVDSADDLVVVGTAANGLEALEVVGETHPDVVLMDIRMPELDGLEATRRLARTRPLPARGCWC